MYDGIGVGSLPAKFRDLTSFLTLAFVLHAVDNAFVNVPRKHCCFHRRTCEPQNVFVLQTH